MSSKGDVIAVTGLALEASIARGPGISVLCNQGLRLRAALGAAVARGASGIVSFGLAGGLKPDLVAGDWVVASGIRNGKDVIATDSAWAQRLLAKLPVAVHAEVVGVDALVLDSSEKFHLHKTTGAAAVDMESHIAAEVAADHRIPFAACRVIIDAAHRALPHAATLRLRANGTPDIPAVIRSVLHKPSQLQNLIRIACDARIAVRALRSGRKRLGVGIGFPHYRSFALDPVFADRGAAFGASEAFDVSMD